MTDNNLGRSEARARAQLLSVRGYDVELDFRGASKGSTFRSRSVVSFTCRTPGSSTWVDLTCTSVRTATLNGTALDVAGCFDGNRLRLDGLDAVNVLVVEAEMSYMQTGEGVHRFYDPVDDAVYLYTQFEAFDAHRMYACFDQPDLKATYRFTVHALPGWIVVSNAEATGRPAAAADETGTWTFAETRRMSTYITAVVAGPFASAHDTHDGIPLGIYCRRSLAEHLHPDDLFTVTKQGFDFYHRVFGYRYPFEKYDQLFVPEFLHGAMENAGAVTIAESALFQSRVTDASHERRAMTILHEMAHMWFGNLVTMRWWDDLWLNESFAAYMSVLCQVEATRFTRGWTTFANTEKTWAYRQDQLPSTHPVAADMTDIETVKVNFDGITYAKGAAVLKQLVAWVGQDVFLCSLSAYFRKHEFGNTDAADLLHELEAASGRDLSAWSDQWLQTAGCNTLRARFNVGPDGRFTSFSVLQEASPQWPTLRDHRLAIGLYDFVDGQLVRTHRTEVDVTGVETRVPQLLDRPRPALVLVNDDDLTYAKIRLDDHSLGALMEHIGDMESPLARALCWSAAWDMTRDAEMRARDYIGLVRGGIRAEGDIGVVQSLLQQAQTALTLYADPQWAHGARAAFATEAFEAAEEQGNPDLRLAWLHTAIALAWSADQLACLKALLNGSHVIPGMVVDTDLRWRILQRLVGQGAAADAEIDRELALDSSASGHRRALTCRAARPTPAAKEQAWLALTESQGLNNADQAALVAGFRDPDQAALLEDYVAPYFEALAEVWAARGAQMAQNFTLGAFPSFMVSPWLVDQTDAYLTSRDLPTGLARLLSESRDELERALRARHRDSASS